MRSWILASSASIVCGCFSPSTLSDDGVGSETGASSAGSASACSEYCTLVDDHCTGSLSQYAGRLECERVCATLPAGSDDDVAGNTVGCRTFHAVSAAEDPQMHCAHAGPAGGGVCGGDCESFCTIAMDACTGELAPWPDFEACTADCGGFARTPAYSSAVMSGDSYACRLYHATLAALQPEPHCSHIGLVSDVCTDAAVATDTGGSSGGDTEGGLPQSCDAYCEAYLATCTAIEGQDVYADTAACLATCASWPAGAPGDVDGNSLACRIYHVELAASVDPEIHCPHADDDGTGICVD